MCLHFYAPPMGERRGGGGGVRVQCGWGLDRGDGRRGDDRLRLGAAGSQRGAETSVCVSYQDVW